MARVFTDKQIARAAHAINCVIQDLAGDDTPADQSLFWYSPHTRKSFMQAVKLAVQPGMTADEMHRRWVEFKLADGWTWGPAVDRIRKTHPNLVPRSELPVTQQVKDDIALSVIRILYSAENGPATVKEEDKDEDAA